MQFPIALHIGEHFSDLYPELRNSAVEIVRPPSSV
jgi:hypothetical protein